MENLIVLIVIAIALWALLGGRGNLARRFVNVALNVVLYRIARLMLNAVLRRWGR